MFTATKKRVLKVQSLTAFYMFFTTPRNKRSPHPLSRKHLFASNRDHDTESITTDENLDLWSSVPTDTSSAQLLHLRWLGHVSTIDFYLSSFSKLKTKEN